MHPSSPNPWPSPAARWTATRRRSERHRERLTRPTRARRPEQLRTRPQRSRASRTSWLCRERALAGRRRMMATLASGSRLALAPWGLWDLCLSGSSPQIFSNHGAVDQWSQWALYACRNHPAKHHCRAVGRAFPHVARCVGGWGGGKALLAIKDPPNASVEEALHQQLKHDGSCPPGHRKRKGLLSANPRIEHPRHHVTLAHPSLCTVCITPLSLQRNLPPHLHPLPDNLGSLRIASIELIPCV